MICWFLSVWPYYLNYRQARQKYCIIYYREYNASKRIKAKQVIIGASNQYLKLGTQRYIWEQYGLTAEKIAERIKQELNK